MRSVSVDPAAKTVTAQGGALWSDVDTGAEKYGLAAVGGTVNHTGIGGLTLGGGYGFLTGKAGLVIDNMLEVEMVLADGSIVAASDKENVDLFWAARGAGSSFGVATKFVFRAHELKGPVWGGMLVFPKTQLEQVVKFSNAVFDPALDGKAMVLMAFGAPPPAFQPVVMTALFYNGPEEEAKSFFEPLLSLGPLANMTAAMPYSGANAMLNAGMGPGARRKYIKPIRKGRMELTRIHNSMKGSSFVAPLDFHFAESLFTDFETFIARLPDAGMTVILFEFVPFHKLLSVPHDATAFANRGPCGNLMFGPAWTDPAFDDECREWTREMGRKGRAEFARRVKAAGRDEGQSVGVGEYGNYDGLDESGGTTLFGGNAERLRRLKEKYDPANLFRKGPRVLS